MSSYFSNILQTLLRKKWILLLFIIFFAITACIAGYMKVQKDNEAIPGKKAEIEAYLEQVGIYEQAIADSETALVLATDQVDDLQKYIDNSIYMKLDPNRIYVGFVQYVIQPCSGTNQSSVMNDLNAYVLQGGLREDIAVTHPDVEVEFWNDLIGTNISGQTLTVTIIRESDVAASDSIAIIKECLESHKSVTQRAFGEFDLLLQDTSIFTKADTAVLNGQNNHRNNLKSYTSSKSDYEVRVYNQRNTLASYIDQNEPDSLTVVEESTKRTALIWGVSGAILGLWVGIGFALLDYFAALVLSGRKEIERLGLTILGYYHNREMSKKDVESIVSTVLQQMQADGKTVLCVYAPNGGKKSACLYADFSEALTSMKSIYIDEDMFTSTNIECIFACKSILFLLEDGSSYVADVRNSINFCCENGVRILGCVEIK